MDTIQAINRVFETSPDTVYGILVGVLAIAVVALWVEHNRKRNQYIDKLIQLNVTSVESLKAINSALDRIRDSNIANMSDLKDEIGHTREHIALLIRDLEHLMRHERKNEKD